MKALLYPEIPNDHEHTCCFDPRTLRQLVTRYGLTLGTIECQSRFAHNLSIAPAPRLETHVWID